MPTPLHRTGLLSLSAVATVLKLDGILVDSIGVHDSCYVDRFHPSAPKPDYPLTVGLLYGSYLLVLIICVLASIKQRINVLKSAYMIAMNLGAYCLLVFFKNYFMDTTCNQNKGNGVSGHFAFYVFHLLTLPYMWVESAWPSEGEPGSEKALEAERRKKSSVLTLALRAAYIVFAVVSVWTLYRTYFYGYHSLRQSINGVMFGVAMHIACVVLTRKFDSPSPELIEVARRVNPTVEPIPADIPLIAFGLSTFASLILCYTYIGKLPLATWEIGVLLLAWGRILWGPTL